MVNKVDLVLKFDGPALKDGYMDVEVLSPSILALARVMKAASKIANGDVADAKIMIEANMAKGSFEMHLELVISAWSQTKLFFASDDVQTAKEIAEWVIGIGVPVGGSLYWLVKKLRGRKIKNIRQITDEKGIENTEIVLEGEGGSIKVNPLVYELYKNPLTRQKALEVLAPLETDGYESVTFYDNSDGKWGQKEAVAGMSFSKDEVPSFNGEDLPEVAKQEEHRATIRTKVKIRKAIYEGNARWTVVYKQMQDVMIEDKQWLQRFQSGVESAPPGSHLDVDLEERYIKNEDGEIISAPAYRIVKVHSVELPMQPVSLG